jgi:hypothetical protein
MPKPILTTLKNALTAGAGYSNARKCLVVGGVDKHLDLVDGEWQLVNAPAGRKIDGPVAAFLSIASVIEGWDDNQGVLCIARNVQEEAFTSDPFTDYGPFGPQDRTIVEGSLNGQPAAVFGAP